ncbi:hypothetical protein Ancab_036572 [Ancistrocladus abbreviatus]
MAQQSSLSVETETLSHVLGLMEAFRAFDSDSDGRITAAELAGIMGSLGYKVTDQEVRTMMQQGDRNRDGLLSLSEFLEMNTKEMELGNVAALLKIAFETFDVEGDDVLTGEELHLVIQGMGIGFSLEDCQDLIASMDVDGDGCANVVVDGDRCCKDHWELGRCVKGVDDEPGSDGKCWVNEEITGECLYFLGEDCRPDWEIKNADGSGSSSSSNGCAETKDPANSGPDNTQKNKEQQVIGKVLGDELARGTPKTYLRTKAACCNDDFLNFHITVDTDGGGRNRGIEGLVEREATVGVQEPINAGSDFLIHEGTIGRNFQAGILESPSIIHRPLDGATPDLVCGPANRELKKANRLVSKPNNPNTRQESGGPMNLEDAEFLRPGPRQRAY